MLKYRFLENEHLHQLFSERKQDWENLTGTTTILDVLGKPLTWWAAECAAVECLEAGDKIPTIREEYLFACESGNKKVGIDALQVKYPIFKKARFAHFDSRNKKAEEGTDLHAELEKYVKWNMAFKSGVGLDKKELTQKWDDKVISFARWAEENVKRFIGSEVYCYEELLFIGGIIDCVAELKDGSYTIIDFKSAKEAYFSMFVQCALYNLQLSRNGALDANGKSLFKLDKPISQYVVVPFGAKELKPVVNNNIINLQEAALACIKIYRQKSFFENQ